MLCDNTCNNAGDSATYCTCLGHLERHNADRIVSIYVATPKVTKASTVSCRFRWRQQQRYHITFANVNMALSGVYIGKGDAITPMTMTRDSNTLVLVLATLGGTT